MHGETKSLCSLSIVWFPVERKVLNIVGWLFLKIHITVKWHKVSNVHTTDTLYLLVQSLGNMCFMRCGCHSSWLSISILTFVGPCIVTYFYSKTNQMHNVSNLFYFGTTLYVFQTVFPSIIRRFEEIWDIVHLVGFTIEISISSLRTLVWDGPIFVQYYMSFSTALVPQLLLWHLYWRCLYNLWVTCIDKCCRCYTSCLVEALLHSLKHVSIWMTSTRRM